MEDNETGKNTGEMAASAWSLGEMTRRELAVTPAKDEGVKDPCILIGPLKPSRPGSGQKKKAAYCRRCRRKVLVCW